MIRLTAPALIRVVDSVLRGFTDRIRTHSSRPWADATPPADGLRVERPWVHPGRPPWIKRDARAVLNQFLDDVADAIAPPPGTKIGQQTAERPETRYIDEDDE